MSERSRSASPAETPPPQAQPSVQGSVSELALVFEQRAVVVTESTTSNLSVVTSDTHSSPPASIQNQVSDSASVVTSDTQSSPSASIQDHISDSASVDTEEAVEQRKAHLKSILRERVAKELGVSSPTAKRQGSSPRHAEASSQPKVSKSTPNSEKLPSKEEDEHVSPESAPIEAESSSTTSVRPTLAARLAKSRRLEERANRREEVFMRRGGRQIQRPLNPEQVDADAGGEVVTYGRRARFLVRIESRDAHREYVRSQAASRHQAAEPRSLSAPPPETIHNRLELQPLSQEWPVFDEWWRFPQYTTHLPSTTPAVPTVSALNEFGGVNDLDRPLEEWNRLLPPNTTNQPSTSSAVPPLSILDEFRGTDDLAGPLDDLNRISPLFTENQPSTSSAVPPSPRLDGQRPSINPAPPVFDQAWFSSPYVENQPASQLDVPASVPEDIPGASTDGTTLAPLPLQEVSKGDDSSATSKITTSQTESSRSVTQPGSAEIRTSEESVPDGSDLILTMTNYVSDDYSLPTEHSDGGEANETVSIEGFVVTSDYEASASDDAMRPPSPKRRRD